MKIIGYNELRMFTESIRLKTNTIFYQIKDGILILSVVDEKNQLIHEYRSYLKSNNKKKQADLVIEGIRGRTDFEFKEKLEDDWQ